MKIDSHRLLLGKRKAIIGSLAADPTTAKLLFANASLAFKDAGVDLSAGMSNHVLHTVKQSKEATTRRERLTAELRAVLGVVPHPSDPVWLAKTLFTKLRVAPLATSGYTPIYQPSIPLDVQARLRTSLPPATRPRLPSRMGTTTEPQIVFRLDLDAEIPQLEPAKRAPVTVSLPELWFYLDSHDLVRPVLELGILEVSVMPTLTRTQYEAVRKGARTGGFLDWVTEVRFSEDKVASTIKRAPAKVTAKKATAKKATAKKVTKKAAVKKPGS